MFQNFLTNSGPNPLKKLVMEIDGFFIVTSSEQTVLLWNNKQLKRSLLITEIQRALRWIIKGTDEGLNKRFKLITLISYIFQKSFSPDGSSFEHLNIYLNMFEYDLSYCISGEILHHKFWVLEVECLVRLMIVELCFILFFLVFVISTWFHDFDIKTLKYLYTY